MPKNAKYWKSRIKPVNTQEYYHHYDLRHIDDLNDDGLAYLLTNVKGINMLDLNETEISNASIKLLTTLEYVLELRLKGCAELDNDCVADLNKLTTLQFLHIKGTYITIDGILQLTQLVHLKELLFSADDVDAIKDKMLLLRNILPNCAFVVDGKPYSFD